MGFYLSIFRRVVPKVFRAAIPNCLKKPLAGTAFRITSNPAWALRLGSYYEQDLELDQASKSYSLALEASKASEKKVAYHQIQRCQFRLNHVRYKRGFLHAIDPLMNTKLLLGQDHHPIPDSSPGTFKVKLYHLGLQISGRLYQEECHEVDLFLDDALLRRLKVEHRINGSIFKYSIKRSVLEHFPAQGELSVRTPEGTLLSCSGMKSMLFKGPHGNGKIFRLLKDQGQLDKKGYLRLSKRELRNRQEEYLNLYSKAREVFDTRFGSPLFLIYGTLLGLHRDGDFIPGDDDFDVAYVSREQNSQAVKDETKKIIMELVRTGFTVSLNRKGKPFRLSRLKKGESPVHLDVRPVWYQNGCVWAHKQACLPLTLDDFLNTKTSTLRETEVYLPADPEPFLRAYYGPGWKVPDPGFSNASTEVPRHVKENLMSLCLTPDEVRVMQADLGRERERHPEMGQLIAIGLVDLYPLESFYEKCGS